MPEVDTAQDDSAITPRDSDSDEDMDLQKLSDTSTSTIPRADDAEATYSDTDTEAADAEASELHEHSQTVGRIQLDLSPAQVVGGSLAAATAAALSSGLGVAGTIAGAAVISMVTAVAGALYTQSLRRTRERARAAAALIAIRRRGAEAPDLPVRAPVGIALRPRTVIASVLVVFTLALAAITGFEMVTGHPLSGGSAGTTLGELTGAGPDSGSGRSQPAPVDQEPTVDPDLAGDKQTPATEPSEPSTSAPSTESGSPTPSPPTDPVPSPTPPGRSDAPG